MCLCFFYRNFPTASNASLFNFREFVQMRLRHIWPWEKRKTTHSQTHNETNKRKKIITNPRYSFSLRNMPIIIIMIVLRSMFLFSIFFTYSVWYFRGTEKPASSMWASEYVCVCLLCQKYLTWQTWDLPIFPRRRCAVLHLRLSCCNND